MLAQDATRAVGDKRGFTGQKLEQNHTERVDVDAVAGALCPSICSGAMYVGVPSETPVVVLRVPPSAWSSLAMPKSRILARSPTAYRDL